MDSKLSSVGYCIARSADTCTDAEGAVATTARVAIGTFATRVAATGRSTAVAKVTAATRACTAVAASVLTVAMSTALEIV